jgi:chemotaxis protein methyltransferase CheR
MARTELLDVVVVHRTPDLPQKLARRLLGMKAPVKVTAVELAPRSLARVREARPAVAVVEVDDTETIPGRIVEGIAEDAELRGTAVIAITHQRRPSFRMRLFGIVHPDDGLGAVEALVLSAVQTLPDAAKRRTSPDFNFSESARMRLLDLVRSRTGILVDRDRAQNLEKAVRERMQARKVGSVWEYLTILSAGAEGMREFDEIVPAFTIAETSFFRTEAHFRAVKSLIIPDFLRRKKRGIDKIRVWSAGSSTGEEAYSLAMMFNEEVGDLYAWDFKVIATDINLDSLDRAREALYARKAVAKLSKDQIGKYFDVETRGYRVKPFLRDLVEFRRLNLHRPNLRVALGEQVDLILCENVIIYFDRSVLEALAEQFFTTLTMGGFLFLGYSESLYKVNHPLEDISFENTFFYRKRPRGRVREHTREYPSSRFEERPSTTRRDRRTSTVVRLRPPEPKPAPVAEAPVVIAEVKAPVSDPLEAIFKGEFEAALTLLAAEALERPAESEPRLLMAFVEARQGNHGKAQSILEEVLERHGLEAPVRYMEGLLLVAAEKFDDAVAAFRNALFLDMDHYPSHFGLGEVLARQGREGQAARHFENVLEILDRSAEEGRILTLDGVLAGARLATVCVNSIQALKTT